MKRVSPEMLVSTRRSHILKVAAEVFARKGFHPTTIKQIAKEAGVADGTIYNYFENKTALLFGIFDSMRESALQDEDSWADDHGDFRLFIRNVVARPLLALKADDFGLFRVVISEILVNEELRRLYRERVLEPTLALAEPRFQEWVERGAFKSLDRELIVRVLYGMTIGLVLENILGDDTLKARWEELPDFLSGLLLHGIASDMPDTTG